MSGKLGKLTTRPLTPERWDDLEDLFGPQGACLGCWCMYWRLARKDWDAQRGDGAKRLFHARVRRGPPPGVLAFAADLPVGWLQIGPRADAPQWNTAKRVSAPMADAPSEDRRIWAASCFFVRRGWRGRGVSAALLDGGLTFARKNGARLVEACPAETRTRMDAASLYVGAADVFRRAGFQEIARRKENRPLMRATLARAPLRRRGAA